MGDTWTIRYGSRRGIQQLVNGEPVPVGPLGDAGGSGGSYTYPNVPRTNDEAVQAYVYLLNSAWKEDVSNKAFFQGKIKAAKAGSLKGQPITTILRIAAATVRTSPGTYSAAEALMNKAGAGYSSKAAPTKAAPTKAAPAKTPKKRKAEEPYTQTLPTVSDEPDVVKEDWTEKIPTWAPWAAGAAAVATALLIAFAPPRTAKAVTP